MATVFAHRVEELVSRGSFLTEGDSARALGLGHLIAHEIGHLLLGKDSHAPRGLMRYPWKARDLKQAAWGGLTFTGGQTSRIRDELGERTRELAVD